VSVLVLVLDWSNCMWGGAPFTFLPLGMAGGVWFDVNIVYKSGYWIYSPFNR